MDPQQIAVLGDRAKNLNNLKTSPGWQELRTISEARKKKCGEQLAAKLLRRGSVFDQREADYLAGFFAGMTYLLDSTDWAEESFERALRRHHRSDQP